MPVIRLSRRVGYGGAGRSKSGWIDHSGILGIIDQFIRYADEFTDFNERRPIAKMSYIYFKRFLFHGLLDDIDKAIVIEEEASRYLDSGIYRQARWVVTQSDADFNVSAEQLEKAASDSQDWYHSCALTRELYQQNSTVIETYIGELERLGYSSTLRSFLEFLRAKSRTYESKEIWQLGALVLGPGGI
jgi:hypothetical protein